MKRRRIWACLFSVVFHIVRPMPRGAKLINVSPVERRSCFSSRRRCLHPAFRCSQNSTLWKARWRSRGASRPAIAANPLRRECAGRGPVGRRFRGLHEIQPEMHQRLTPKIHRLKSHTVSLDGEDPFQFERRGLGWPAAKTFFRTVAIHSASCCFRCGLRRERRKFSHRHKILLNIRVELRWSEEWQRL